MSYKHLTISERHKIETYLELGFSIRAIAKKIKRNPLPFQERLMEWQPFF